MRRTLGPALLLLNVWKMTSGVQRRKFNSADVETAAGRTAKGQKINFGFQGMRLTAHKAQQAAAFLARERREAFILYDLDGSHTARLNPSKTTSILYLCNQSLLKTAFWNLFAVSRFVCQLRLCSEMSKLLI